VNSDTLKNTFHDRNQWRNQVQSANWGCNLM
jgi:hypothetical protein